ncbi:hypothetical protein [Bacillus bombysepticus]|uniref:hypothetical protein n=1 Tax=Bacillus bombysepticus TaxID=658666 RepID=UPI00301B6BF6|nr:hypothetical protein [Bacillus cereus]MDA2549575.1 hypothetical protein [Bacillus cereus]MDA2554674.1 hypothetical protein [Bacillus cereus]
MKNALRKLRVSSLALTLGVVSFGIITPNANAEELVYRVGDTVYDNREVEDKTTIQESLNPLENAPGLAAQPTVNSKVSRYLVPPLISATATSSATMKQNKIVAKTRAYNDLGGLMGTKTDSASNSSYAGATVSTGIKYISRAIGNHTYEKSGYVTINHETRTS